MRSETTAGLAVRKASGEIVFEREPVKSASKKNWFTRLLFVRGVVAFVDMLDYGMKTTTKSAKLYGYDEEYKPNRFERFIANKTGKDVMDIAMGFAVVVAIVLAVGIFFILPNVLADLLQGWIYGKAALTSSQEFVMNLIDGAIRLLIFIIYILGVTLMKDIKRVFRYHGAEHKTINCYEHEEDLTVENIQKFRTLHPRCGTSYLLLVMVLSILLFSIFGWGDAWYTRIGLRLLMLPVVAGVAYEFLKFAARSDSLFFRIIRWPGLMLQKLTTAQPDDSMVETAIVAFRAAQNEMTDQELQALADSFRRQPMVASIKTEDEVATQPEE
jgi:uncharacterized protein YqhQ